MTVVSFHAAWKSFVSAANCCDWLSVSAAWCVCSEAMLSSEPENVGRRMPANSKADNKMPVKTMKFNAASIEPRSCGRLRCCM